MKVKLVFDDWRGKNGESIYNTEKGLKLSSGDFHSGTTFKGEIDLDEGDTIDLKKALKKGNRPVFVLYEDN